MPGRSIRQRLVHQADHALPGLMNRLRTHVHVDWKKTVGHAGLLTRVFPLIDARRTTAVDVGANTGVMSRFLARHFARVEAIEAVPKLAERLTRAGLKRVVVHAVAAGATEGRANLRFPLAGGGEEGFALATLKTGNQLALFDKDAVAEMEVKVRTLDGLLSADAPVSFVKIDVEGFEGEVIAGARGLIARRRPVLMVEIGWMHNPDYRNAVETLKFAGYTMLTPRRSHAILGDLAHIEAQPGHATNDEAEHVDWDFLFVPNERRDIIQAATAA